MERMTRRGQAPVKKELVEASMSAFVFWMGTIAIGYMLVANSGWSLPFVSLTCCPYCSCSQSDPSFPRPHSSSRPRDILHTRGRRDPGNLDDYPSLRTYISPRCMSKKIDDERESALIKIPPRSPRFSESAPWGERQDGDGARIRHAVSLGSRDYGNTGSAGARPKALFFKMMPYLKMILHAPIILHDRKCTHRKRGSECPER